MSHNYNYNHNHAQNQNDQRSKFPDTNRGSMGFKQTDNDTWTLVPMNKKIIYRGDRDTDTFNGKTSKYNDSHMFNSNGKRNRYDDNGKTISSVSDKRDYHYDKGNNYRDRNDNYDQHKNDYHESRTHNTQNQAYKHQLHQHHQQYQQHQQNQHQQNQHQQNQHQQNQHQQNQYQNDIENDDNISINNDKYKNDNYKKILCKNINSIGKCIYTNKCLYAHSIDEQNMEPIRVIAYDMIKKNDDLSHIDLTKNKQLYNNLLALSKVCQQCDEGTCTGGYNCKHGACDKIYVICQIDLNKGTCEGGCGKIHLTKKGLTPFGVNVVKNLKSKVVVPKATIINEEFFKQLNNNISNKIESNQKHNNFNVKLKPALAASTPKFDNDNSLSENESDIDSDDNTNDDFMSGDESNTWAMIVKNDSHVQPQIRIKKREIIPQTNFVLSEDNVHSKTSNIFGLLKNQSTVCDNNTDMKNDSMSFEESDDDLFTKLDNTLDNIGQDSDSIEYDMAFNREEKLKKSVFKIDMMCI